jgi:hypothetical protein
MYLRAHSPRDYVNCGSHYFQMLSTLLLLRSDSLNFQVTFGRKWTRRSRRVKQLIIVKICYRMFFVAVFVRACVFAVPCALILSKFLPGKSWSLILLNNIFCHVANCVIEAWVKNMQRIFRLVVVDGILHTQFICHACMSVSEIAVEYLFHSLSPARCIWRNVSKITLFRECN